MTLFDISNDIFDDNVKLKRSLLFQQKSLLKIVKLLLIKKLFCVES
jgi:hypothetical protein